MKEGVTKDFELIHASLEKLAETVHDLSPLVYQRFFALHPEAVDMFGHDPENMVKGNMINDILYAVLDQAAGMGNPEQTYEWAINHVAYAVTRPMYQVMFDAIIDTLASCLGDYWNEDLAAAWWRQFEAMMVVVEEAFQVDEKMLPHPYR